MNNKYIYLIFVSFLFDADDENDDDELQIQIMTSFLEKLFKIEGLRVNCCRVVEIKG